MVCQELPENDILHHLGIATLIIQNLQYYIQICQLYWKISLLRIPENEKRIPFYFSMPMYRLLCTDIYTSPK